MSNINLSFVRRGENLQKVGQTHIKCRGDNDKEVEAAPAAAEIAPERMCSNAKSTLNKEDKV